jgi:hypothetical protein
MTLVNEAEITLSVGNAAHCTLYCLSCCSCSDRYRTTLKGQDSLLELVQAVSPTHTPRRVKKSEWHS